MQLPGAGLTGTCRRPVSMTCPDIELWEGRINKKSRASGSLGHHCIFPFQQHFTRCRRAILLRSVPHGIDRFHFQKPLHQVLDCLKNAQRSVSHLQIPLLPIRERLGEAANRAHLVGHRAFPFHVSVRSRITSQSQKGLNASPDSERAHPPTGGLPPDSTLSGCRQIVNELSTICNNLFAFHSVHGSLRPPPRINRRATMEIHGHAQVQGACANF